jgi:dolichol-phosphate mannosyltransferase
LKKPIISVVIPAYNEGEDAVTGLIAIHEAIVSPHEILVIVDRADDTTKPSVENLGKNIPEIKCLVSTLQPGPANAIRFGFSQASSEIFVVSMADGCDDPRQIEELARLINRGVAVASASRYMPGGQQVGGPRFKGILSRFAGRILYSFAGVGTRDATNSFKAYSREFVELAKPESRNGFELGLELTAKARRLRKPVAEIPTTWIDRSFGDSNFKIWKWLPYYVRWFLFAFGPKLNRIKEQNV